MDRQQQQGREACEEPPRFDGPLRPYRGTAVPRPRSARSGRTADRPSGRRTDRSGGWMPSQLSNSPTTLICLVSPDRRAVAPHRQSERTVTRQTGQETRLARRMSSARAIARSTSVIRAPGSGLRAPGSGLRAPSSELRAPSSELRAECSGIDVLCWNGCESVAHRFARLGQPVHAAHHPGRRCVGGGRDGSAATTSA
jgi:hypothetical protein